MPGTPQLSGLVPDLLDLRVVLHHDGILEKCSGARISTISIQAIFCIASGATGVYCDVKLSIAPSYPCGQVDTVHVAVEPFAEDDAVERLVKFDRNLHQILLALNIKTGDLWHIRLCLWPWVVSLLGWLDI